MLESRLDAIIWYVFEGAQCQISLIFSIITRMGHFLEQVSPTIEQKICSTVGLL